MERLGFLSFPSLISYFRVIANEKTNLHKLSAEALVWLSSLLYEDLKRRGLKGRFNILGEVFETRHCLEGLCRKATPRLSWA